MRIRPLIPIVSALVLMLPASAGAVGWVTGTPLSAAGRVAVEHVAIQNGDVYVVLDTTRLDGNVRTTTVRVVRLAAGSGQVQAVNGPGGPNLDQASFDSSNQPDTTVPVDSSTITFIRAESKEPLLAAGHGHVDLAWLPSSAQQIDYQELTSGGATQHIATSATSLRAGIDSSGALARMADIHGGRQRRSRVRRHRAAQRPGRAPGLFAQRYQEGGACTSDQDAKPR
jgi:hypothetical protein